jgi:hypothetical protein
LAKLTAIALRLIFGERRPRAAISNNLEVMDAGPLGTESGGIRLCFVPCRTAIPFLLKRPDARRVFNSIGGKADVIQPVL